MPPTFPIVFWYLLKCNLLQQFDNIQNLYHFFVIQMSRYFWNDAFRRHQKDWQIVNWIFFDLFFFVLDYWHLLKKDYFVMCIPQMCWFVSRNVAENGLLNSDLRHNIFSQGEHSERSLILPLCYVNTQRHFQSNKTEKRAKLNACLLTRMHLVVLLDASHDKSN